MLNECCSAKEPSQLLITLMLSKMPKNERRKALKKVMYELSGSLSETNKRKAFQLIIKELSESGSKVKISSEYLYKEKQPRFLIDGFLKEHRSIKNLSKLMRAIYSLKELNDGSMESLMTVIDNNKDKSNRDFLLKMSEYPKWYNKPGSIFRDLVGFLAGFGTGILVASAIVFIPVIAASLALATPIFFGIILISGPVGLGLLKLIPNRNGFKNRKKIRLIKSYAALNLSLCDNKVKKFKKTLDSLNSEEQKKVLTRLIAQGQDNHGRLDIILKAVKGLKDSITIKSIFEDAFLQCISNENQNGIGMIMENVTEEDKNEMLGYAMYQCAINKKQNDFDVVVNNVPSGGKIEAFGYAMYQYAINKKQNDFDVFVDNVPLEGKIEAFGYALYQCAINGNRPGLDMVLKAIPDQTKQQLISQIIDRIPEGNTGKELLKSQIGFIVPKTQRKGKRLEMGERRSRSFSPERKPLLKTTKI